MARAKASKDSDSYYLVVKGKKYDRRMIELAEGLTSGKGDGRISMNDAKNLLRLVKDSNTYSPIEKQTMEYIRRKFKFTKEGDELFRTEIRKWAASKRAAQPKKSTITKSAAATPAVQTAAPVAIASTEPHAAPAGTTGGSALKEILLALLLLAAIAGLFYFIVYKSGCVKTPAAPSLPQVETQTPSAPAPVAAKTEPLPAKADLKDFVEKAKIAFVAEKTTLTAASGKALDALAEKIKSENIKIQISGHTCTLGPAGLNQQISLKRAAAVKEALIARGVKPENLEARGAGSSEPIGDNKTYAGRVANRRVTFKVLQ